VDFQATFAMPEASATPKYQLVGSVQERRPLSSASSNFKPTIYNTGFPAVQHRSKSAFARSREDQTKAFRAERNSEPPLAVSGGIQKFDDEKSTMDSNLGKRLRSSDEGDDWRRRVSEENERKIESMTEEERELEQKEILERFGANVGDILRKAREAREMKGFQGSAETRKEPLLEDFQGTYYGLSPLTGSSSDSRLSSLDGGFRSALKGKFIDVC
jgi:RNA polymerase II-associated protein 1